MAARHPPCRALKPKEKDYKVTDRDGMYVHVTARARWCANWDCRQPVVPNQPRRSVDSDHYAENASDRGSDARREHERDIVLSAPIQYQKQVRLQEAEAKLLASPGDVAAVGYAVGYDSPSQFQPRVPSAVRRAAAGNVAEREPDLESFQRCEGASGRRCKSSELKRFQARCP